MQERIGQLGRNLTMFVAAAVIIGVAGVVMGIGPAMDGEWSGIAGVIVGLLGIAAGAMIWTGKGAGTALDGMNLGMLWALGHLPYLSIFDAEAGTDLEYPVPAFGAIFNMGSSTSVNGSIVTEETFGIGFLGVVLIIWALSARKRWTHIVMAESVRREQSMSQSAATV
jgi:hypothetical protein